MSLLRMVAVGFVVALTGALDATKASAQCSNGRCGVSSGRSVATASVVPMGATYVVNQIAAPVQVCTSSLGCVCNQVVRCQPIPMNYVQVGTACATSLQPVVAPGCSLPIASTSTWVAPAARVIYPSATSRPSSGCSSCRGGSCRIR